MKTASRKAPVRRVKELEERYARPLPELEREVFGAKVEEHLKRMELKIDCGVVR